MYVVLLISRSDMRSSLCFRMLRFESDFVEINGGISEYVKMRMNRIGEQLNQLIATEEFPGILVEALYALANDLDISSFSAEQADVINKDIREDKSWLLEMPTRLHWEIFCIDAGWYCQGSGEIHLDGGFFIASSDSTLPEEVVDFVVLNTALHELIKHGLFHYFFVLFRGDAQKIACHQL